MPLRRFTPALCLAVAALAAGPAWFAWGGGGEPSGADATRRAEEAIERVVLAEATPQDRADSVVELGFAPGAAALTSGARATLDRVHRRLLAGETDYYVDLQGHADTAAGEARDRRLSHLRAEAARRYLHREKDVPLERMGVLPLGSSALAPGAPDGDKVVVVVLRAP
ncbi:MAG: OmpA family protein [Thermoanaerobaculia bacterium]